jgi:hypothetical protein
LTKFSSAWSPLWLHQKIEKQIRIKHLVLVEYKLLKGRQSFLETCTTFGDGLSIFVGKEQSTKVAEYGRKVNF